VTQLSAVTAYCCLLLLTAGLPDCWTAAAVAVEVEGGGDSGGGGWLGQWRWRVAVEGGSGGGTGGGCGGGGNGARAYGAAACSPVPACGLGEGEGTGLVALLVGGQSVNHTLGGCYTIGTASLPAMHSRSARCSIRYTRLAPFPDPRTPAILRCWARHSFAVA
jgi:hypothetical protein